MHLITNGGSVHFAAGTVTETRHAVYVEKMSTDLQPVVIYLDTVANGHHQYVSIGGTPGDIEDFATALLRACDEATTELLHSIAYRQSVADLEVGD
jgi:ribosomal 50S subunit-associated protein YjgA (DUF615 family)